MSWGCWNLELPECLVEMPARPSQHHRGSLGFVYDFKDAEKMIMTNVDSQTAINPVDVMVSMKFSQSPIVCQ